MWPCAPSQSEGAGLRLVRGRLEARYGDDGQMRITTAPGAGFRVALALPAGAPALVAAGQGERDGAADRHSGG
jgi:LytS/YehU family sensor histidine kinase